MASAAVLTGWETSLTNLGSSDTKDLSLSLSLDSFTFNDQSVVTVSNGTPDQPLILSSSDFESSLSALNCGSGSSFVDNPDSNFNSFTCTNGAFQPSMGNQNSMKRKTEQISTEYEDMHHLSLHLYHVTLSKLLSSPIQRVEPPLQRSVVMRNTLKHLECRMFSHTPCKRIFLDTDNSAALNNLHLSPESPPTPELETKFDKMLPVFSDDQVLTNKQDQSSEHNSSQQYYVELQPVVTSNSNLIQPDASESCLPLVMTECVVVEHSIEPNTETNTFFPTGTQLCSTESLEKSTKYTSFSDMEIQTLMNCSMDQYNLKDSLGKTSSQTHGHIDELDNIMQVLVSM